MKDLWHTACVLLLCTVITNRSVAQPPVTDVAVSPDGSTVLSCSQSGLVVHEWPTLKQVHQWEGAVPNPHALAFSPDGRRFAVAGGEPGESGIVSIHSWPDRKRVRVLRDHLDTVTSVFWLDDTQLVTASLDHDVRVWDVDTEGSSDRLTGHSRGVLSVCAIPGADRMISTGIDQSLRVWGISDRHLIHSLSIHTQPVHALSVRPGDRPLPWVASAGEDRTVRFWQPTIGRMVKFARLPSKALCLTWLPDGSQIIVGGQDGRVRLVDPNTVQITRDLPGLKGWMYCVALHPDGDVIAGGEHGQLRRIDLNRDDQQLATKTQAEQQSVKSLFMDVDYAGTDNPRQTLDLFLPDANVRAQDPLPVVVFIHGGGWKGGNKRQGHARLKPFVDSGKYAGVSVGYRLSDECCWPNQIHDCKAAIRWIRANSDVYGLDRDRIGVWGSSAGGHLVAMLGTSGDDPTLDGDLGKHSEQPDNVTCVVDFFGPTNFLTMNETAIEGANLDHDAADSPESRLIGKPIQTCPELVATANPVTFVSKEDPPFLIVHGTQDPLVSYDQSVRLHQALDRVGSESTLVTVRNGGHGRGFGPSVQQQVQRFFDHHLRGVVHQWEDVTVDSVPRPPRRR